MFGLRCSTLLLEFCIVFPSIAVCQNSSQPPTATLAPASAAAPSILLEPYPDSADGLRAFLNDLVDATKNRDAGKVNAFVARSEFPDYRNWFLHTYRNDPDTADDWATTYKDNLARNEGLFRDLLTKLADDDGRKILVRKVNDVPEPNNGLEAGMLRYATGPVDIYCATLISKLSGRDPIENSGYFIYTDGMFRWENLAGFRKPGTYRSAPAAAAPEPAITYPNTSDGLAAALGDMLKAAKSSDDLRLAKLVRNTEIPDYRNWYLGLFVPGSALGWANGYGNFLDRKEQWFEELWKALAKDEGEIVVRKLMDRPGDRGLEWAMLHNSRAPIDIYSAIWRSRTSGTADQWIGYFFFIDGTFRWDNTMLRVRIIKSASGQ